MARVDMRRGFTIVELLIVVVVIAILAAITIVAYTGIQNNTNDASVKSDLRTIAMKVNEYHVLKGEYPKGGAATAGFTDFDPVPVTKSAYESSVNNIYYCVGIVGGSENFGLAARGKSGNRWMFTSMDGLQPYTASAWGSSGGVCDDVGVPRTAEGFSYKFGVTSANVWHPWIR